MILNDKQKKDIEFYINDLFNRLKARLLGRFFKGPSIYFEIVQSGDPIDTMEGIYRYTIGMMYGSEAKIDFKRIKILAKITSNYLDAERLKTINNVILSAEQGSNYQEVQDLVTQNINKALKYTSVVLNTEIKNIQAYAERSGIEQLGASIGVDDPVVCKLGVVDEKLCVNCKKLWHSKENLFIPKVYKLSELKDGYNKDYKNPVPTVSCTHPHCRHTLTMIPPNYGFDQRGNITFKNFGYDEYVDQRAKK